jgi:membrane fusion protein, multidrug efflux system
VKSFLPGVLLAIPAAALLSGCGDEKPPAEVLRPIRTVELRYDRAGDLNRYVGTVQARHEIDHAFRVGGKIVSRKVDVGQTVRQGDVLAVLDDTDYRLNVAAAKEQLAAAVTQARQAESDRKRLEELKADGSVSVSDEEQATSKAATTKATAEAQARNLELAQNRLSYTVLRASRSGAVTAVKFEVGQVVAEGQAGVSIADSGEPEVVVDVPEDHLGAFQKARFKASLATAPDEKFDVVLRELSPQAAAQTRTYRARLKPAKPRRLPLGATATLVVERSAAEEDSVAAIPASAITQSEGQPALWVVRREAGEHVGTVELSRVAVHGYRNEEVLVSGLPAGELIVTAGVQKMAPGLRVVLPEIAAQATATQQAAR